MDWNDTYLELKTKTQKEKLSASFKYTNKTDVEILFIKIKASCGCILVDAPSSVKPGESGVITIKAPIPFGGGSYVKTISVDTSETDNVEYNLKFKVTNTDPFRQKALKNASSQRTKNELSQKIEPQTGYDRPIKMTSRLLLVEKLLARQALARKEYYHTQEECPFLPLPINKNLFYDFEGMRIYTCCEQCLSLLKASPNHAIIKLGEKKQTPSLIR